MALFRRRSLPADRRPPLSRDERVVAFALPVVVTNLGLWLPDRPSRVGWHEVHKAVWTGRELSVVPAEPVAELPEYTVVADAPAVTVALDDPDRVPEQVRTRVNRSIAYSEHHRLPDGRGVRVVARRVPGLNGLHWTVRYDPSGLSDPDPAVAELVAVARAGLPGPV